MKNRLVKAAVTAALLSAACVPAAHAQSAADLQALKAQLEALQKKVSELEAQQKAANEVQDKTLDQVAQQRANVGDWVGRFQWKGDFRYRNETIDQEFIHSNRNRDRIRARFGFFARVNDTLRVEMQATTAERLNGGTNGDARSSNQTLSDSSSRKDIYLDTAYAEWQPNASNKVTFGKMRYPWVRPTGSLFYDGDINPEGLAYNWQQGTNGVFAGVWYIRLTERQFNADSNMLGAQVGWRDDIASGVRLTLAASYNDHSAVQGYNSVQDNNVAQNAFGNGTTTDPTICRPGITPCIASDFDIAEASAELAFANVGGYPLSFMVDYAKNTAEDLTGAQAGLDTAYSAGVQYGLVANAHSWEVGALYQKLENNSLYGQWIDSDFAGGVTGSNGWVLKAGYGFGRNFRLNTTYFFNDTNIDLPTTVVGVGPVTDRKYRRLQVDVNMTF
jgi:outer membrane murein-binding lipoprotein Lpp